jgi:hypothetical protein
MLSSLTFHTFYFINKANIIFRSVGLNHIPPRLHNPPFLLSNPWSWFPCLEHVREVFFRKGYAYPIYPSTTTLQYLQLTPSWTIFCTVVMGYTLLSPTYLSSLLFEFWWLFNWVANGSVLPILKMRHGE